MARNQFRRRKDFFKFVDLENSADLLNGEKGRVTSPGEYYDPHAIARKVGKGNEQREKNSLREGGIQPLKKKVPRRGAPPPNPVVFLEFRAIYERFDEQLTPMIILSHLGGIRGGFCFEDQRDE